MRVLALSIILILSLSHIGYSQSKNETLEWIYTQGEETIQQLTGNTSLHWELDEYGSFRITDFNPSDREIEKIYTYLNLYELDPQKTSIKKGFGDGTVLLLSCRKERGSCIKTRRNFEDSSLMSSESATFQFPLINGFDQTRGRRLEESLVNAIKIFQGQSAGVNR